jgi:hypothetical protein
MVQKSHAWLVDIEAGHGRMSSIFSGFKVIPVDKRPDWIERGSQGIAPGESELEGSTV